MSEAATHHDDHNHHGYHAGGMLRWVMTTNHKDS